jgi:CBS domain containing-hemolysin-like protein
MQGKIFVRIVYSFLLCISDSMSVWNLLREFRIRKVHMAIVLNEYGGTVGVRSMLN